MSVKNVGELETKVGNKRESKGDGKNKAEKHLYIRIVQFSVHKKVNIEEMRAYKQTQGTPVNKNITYKSTNGNIVWL